METASGGMKTTWFLAMDIGAREGGTSRGGLALVTGDDLSPSQYLDIYQRVGRPWGWRSRLSWSDDQIFAHLRRKDRAIRLLLDESQAIGFSELEVLSADCGDLRYFGLVPEAVGHGWSERFLDSAINCARTIGLRRLLIKTSDTDHPNALRLYRKAGFDILEICRSAEAGA